MHITQSSGTQAPLNISSTIRILFITDIHNHPQAFNKNIYSSLLNKVDLVFIGGDMYEYNENNLVNKKDSARKMYYEDFIRFIQSVLQVPVKYILGNHDISNTNLKPDESIVLGEKLIVLTQNGSSSTIIADDLQTDKDIIQLDQEVLWKGIPWGPLEADKENFSKLLSFTAKNRQEITRQIKEAQEPGMIDIPIDTDYNSNQTFVAQLEENKAQYIILSHQGPFNSCTSWDIYDKEKASFLPEKYQNGLYLSSGSPQNQKFYDKYHDQILLWLHGHSHHPKFNQCRQIFNPGKFPNYQIICLKRENDKWHIGDQQFGVLK